jgi:hypothetical protein
MSFNGSFMLGKMIVRSRMTSRGADHLHQASLRCPRRGCVKVFSFFSCHGNNCEYFAKCMTCYHSKKKPRYTSLTADCAASHLRMRVAEALPLPVWQPGLRGPVASHGYRRADRVLVAGRQRPRTAILISVACLPHNEIMHQNILPSLALPEC